MLLASVMEEADSSSLRRDAQKKARRSVAEMARKRIHGGRRHDRSLIAHEKNIDSHSNPSIGCLLSQLSTAELLNRIHTSESILPEPTRRTRF
jgi:hypothetical protein